MASGLSRRVAGIEAALALIVFFHSRLRYLQPSVGELIDSGCRMDSLRENRFLFSCGESMGRGVPFPEAWRDALSSHPGALEGEERAILSSLGQVLGSTDLDSQLDAVSCARAQLEERLERAQSDREKHRKLYSSLGLLSGIALVILLI